MSDGMHSLHHESDKMLMRHDLVFYLWVELAGEMLSHSQACRTGLELLLVKHAVHFTGLATGRSGAGPAASRQKTTDVTQRARQGQRKKKEHLYKMIYTHDIICCSLMNRN